MGLEVYSQRALTKATPEQIDEVYDHFYRCREWFPHIRKDYVARNVKAGKVVYDSGIIIIFNRYQRRQKIGNVEAKKGDIILHQILNPYRQKLDFDKSIPSRILNQFCEEMAADVYLSVRADNDRAIRFYEKNGFERVSETSWMNGKLPGLVFVKRK